LKSAFVYAVGKKGRDAFSKAISKHLYPAQINLFVHHYIPAKKIFPSPKRAS
jgi:hypothetical protein